MDYGSGFDGLPITEEDKFWVEENFKWLKDVFGYPNKMDEQILLTPKFFPATFASKEISIDNIVADLCVIFYIPRDAVTFEVVSDIRDFENVPYQTEGAPFECETILKKGEYIIFVAKSLQKHPDRLIYSLICEFVRIRLTESDVIFDVGGDDVGLFIYLAGIYYGFGVILAQNLLHAGRSSDGLWEIKWNLGSEMPPPVMAYSLATYANLMGTSDPVWKNEFKGDFKMLLEHSLAYLQANPSGLYDEVEAKAQDLFNQAEVYFERRQLDDAISMLQKILSITSDDVLKADVFNNIGYYHVLKGDHAEAISNFREAIRLGPDYGYANDNLGYSLIMTGGLEEGLEYLHKAMNTKNNDIAYTFRNFALYHHRKKQYDLADDFFRKSFDLRSPVDLLEFHYGEFLLALGKIEMAKEFFIKSAEKNEEAGINRLRELGIDFKRT